MQLLELEIKWVDDFSKVHISMQDIMYAEHVLCRSMTNPSHKHFDSAMHTLRYLGGTVEAGITYCHDDNKKPVTLVDADNGTIHGHLRSRIPDMYGNIDKEIFTIHL
jgi:hypothetical protein